MADERTSPTRARRAVRPGILLFAFAFAVMADPVSSVAYAIEAGLRALAGDLLLLVPTMLIVLGIISVVRLNYDQLIRRFPQGGGAVAAAKSGAAHLALEDLQLVTKDHELDFGIELFVG